MSHQTFSITFFAVSNEAGRDLAQRFAEMAGAEFGLRVNVLEGATQTQFFRACLDDDVVVLDASAETGETYAAATAQPMALDKVLVVSRTYLPLNFYGLREGGAPDYPEPSFQDNETILVWLREHLSDLLREAGGRPRRKGFIGYFRAMRESLNTQERRWNSSGRIFISYRSRHAEGVERLRQLIEGGRVRGVPPSTVRFLRPGQLAYEDELMTKLRHWQLASMIDRRLGAAEEMWVYATEDYLASWWTRAELMTVAYRLAAGTRAPRVRLFDPASGALSDPPRGWLPDLSREQQRRMARWYANTDPGSMGPESVPVMRVYAGLPLLGRFKYFSDPVWGDEFWHSPLLPCVTCRRDAGAAAELDVDAFLWLREPHLVPLTPEQVEEAVGRGSLDCPACDTTYEITEAAHPRLLWMPTRFGKATGPDGASLVALPVYRASKRALLRKRRAG